MNNYLIVKENGRFFSLVTREIIFDETKLELIETNLIPNKETDTWNGSEWMDNSVIVVPQQVHNHKLRLAMIHFGILPSSIDTAIDAIPDLTMREKIYTLWNFAPMLERANTSLNYMATQFEISPSVLNEIFIYANSLS